MKPNVPVKLLCIMTSVLYNASKAVISESQEGGDFVAKLMLSLAKLDAESFKIVLQNMTDEQKAHVETMIRRAVSAVEQNALPVSKAQIQLKSFI